jgi:3-dehydroquinate synthase
MKTVTVNASTSYDILIGDGLLDRAGELCAEHIGICRVCVVTDDTVHTLYFDRLLRTLTKAGYEVYPFVIPHGEASKSTASLVALLEFCAEHRLTRSDALIALGGGVVGDLGGFCAATYLRGIGFVQVPTTLLACVDSSVGGKTAVNLPEGKNLLGAFYQPQLVLCDPTVLATLPRETYADGMAEVIKYGMIRDRALFEALEAGTLDDGEIIARCVAIKRDVVEADEHDRGCRALLNYGHTIGHAVEKCSHFAVSHGSGVAIGMAMLARAMVKKGAMAAEDARRLCALLERYALPTSCEYGADALYNAALSDKKRAGDTLSLITVPTIGRGEVTSIPVEALRDDIEKGSAV